MGAWGEGIFDNDDACDFVAAVVETSNLSRVEEALDAVLKEDSYLEAPLASEGLAAADIVARLCGQSGQNDDYTETMDEWVKTAKLKPSAKMLEKAQRVVDRTRSESSELLELWSEDDPAPWLATLDELAQRLATAATSIAQ